MASFTLRNFAIPAMPVSCFSEAEIFPKAFLPPSLSAAFAELLSPLKGIRSPSLGRQTDLAKLGQTALLG